MVLSRLLGIPFLIAIGFLSALEAQWVALGVFAVCVAEVVGDMSSAGLLATDELEVPLD